MADNITTTFPSPPLTTEGIVDPDDPESVPWVPYVGALAGIAVIAAIVFTIYRFRRHRYDYQALRDIEDLPGRMLKDQKLIQDADRDAALLKCSFYLRSSLQYRLIEHLPDVGCRPKKSWFIVRTVDDHRDKLLTMMPRSDTMIPPFSKQTRQTLNDLFHMLQHPYLQPIEELDFQLDSQQVVIVQPFCALGSIKDLIHGVRCVDSWEFKYCYPGNGLPMHNIQNYGRQILEGMHYLRKRGLPPVSHLHSGNVLVERDTCRIAGYENTLLGYNNRMLNYLRKPLKKNGSAVDSLCFGHLIFEMASGQMLDCPMPLREHYNMVPDEPTKQLLKFIFADLDNIPDTDALMKHRFFEGVHLAKLDVIPKVKKSLDVKALLKSVKKGRHQAKPKVQQLEPMAAGPLDDARSAASSSSSKPTTEPQPETPSNPSVRRKSSSSSLAKPPKARKPSVPKKPTATEATESSALLGPAGGSTPTPTKQAGSDSTPIKQGGPGRSALLSQIKQGMNLRKTPNAFNPRV